MSEPRVTFTMIPRYPGETTVEYEKRRADMLASLRSMPRREPEPRIPLRALPSMARARHLPRAVRYVTRSEVDRDGLPTGMFESVGVIDFLPAIRVEV